MIQLKQILVATDFGEASDAALTYGRALARTFGATLHVLHVAENVFTRGIGGEAYIAVFPDLQKDVEEAARKQLDELLIDNDPVKLPSKGVVLTSNTPAMADRGLLEGGRRGPHRDGHARPRRGRAPADGQRRRARRPHGAVPRADRAIARSTTS